MVTCPHCGSDRVEIVRHRSINIFELVREFRKYDNPTGYKLRYAAVKNKIWPLMESMAEKGEEALSTLHEMLKHAETWSCLFALETLKEIRSEKSIPFLIKFIRDNEHGDFWEGCDEAMFALQSIGKASVEALIDEVRSDFEKNVSYNFLMEALTRVKDDRAYSFMASLLTEYIANRGQHDKFSLDLFVGGFTKQGNKEILPVLENLLEKEWINESEFIEIEDAISFLRDPESYKALAEEEAAAAAALERAKPGHEAIAQGMERRKKIGRNEPCPCGSGKKFKKCCLGKQV